ncbi:MAG: hypothetical protein SFU99_01675 [Saprospiraceae bacterium]|nr:hypothetical protein [Saprospiraceae bacterium]
MKIILLHIMELFQLKQTAFNYCQTAISNRIHTIETALKSLEESRDHESKSSVGDKYETGRAMLHLEEEKNKAQLAEAVLAKSVLASIDLSRAYNKVEIGSLVITNNGKYFIAIGIGKILIDKELIYGISLDSPIGQELKDKKVGDQFSFNERLIRIDTIV